ncbi:MAG: hypothetical protein KBB11_03540 [Bacteroidales bacterium]|mgnify:CR=1 FL=1|nr:hypothetical protein [Bacteroidales bacterium]HOY38401.1 DUF6089 family protein [Bacteroidales bacterium]HQP04330.1 DUF6089 family protein [Bacteroidales bacterium]
MKPVTKLITGCLLILSSLIHGAAFGQRSGGGEIGVMAGGSYYMGDINLAIPFYQPHLNLGGFYKHHLNSRLSVRVGFFASSLSADDQDFNSYYQKLRNSRFSTNMMEISLQTEFNFLPYLMGELRKRNYTPYLQTGLAYYLTPGSAKVTGLSIPVGLGFKVNISHRMVLSAEWGFRRTFTDLLDNTTGEDLYQYNTVDNIPYNATTGIRQIGFAMNKDWYSYASLGLSYCFSWGGFPCPAYDVY